MDGKSSEKLGRMFQKDDPSPFLFLPPHNNLWGKRCDEMELKKGGEVFSECDWWEAAVFSRLISGGSPGSRSEGAGEQRSGQVSLADKS
jgi:hypothetical protein